jgi:gas vesicle protein
MPQQMTSTGGVTGSISRSPQLSRGSGAGGAFAGSAAGALTGSAILPGPGTLAGAAIGAGISGVASLLGAKKNSNASRDSMRMQVSAADRALAAQREMLDRQTADELRDRESRRQNMAQFDERRASNASRLAPAYGESQAQADARRMNSFGQPQGGAQGGGPPTQMAMSQGQPPQPPQGALPPQGAPPPNAFGMPTGATVWMQAPNGGETMEVPMEPWATIDALLKKGATIIQPPTEQMGRA